jgi:hypothetical protein
LLGFGNAVKRIGKDVLERHRVVEALKLVKDTLSPNPAVDLRFTHFSDCIVISAEHSPHGLWEMFQSIELLTFNLLQYDFFVRGGLTLDLAHHSHNFVFGTGVTDAYLLERDEADFPLVLVSPQVVKNTSSYGPEFTQWLKEDGQGRFFVHYLMRYAEYTTDLQVGKVVLSHPAKRIAHFVAKRLESDQGRTLEKAKWFQNYWNSAVASRGVLPRIESGVAATDLDEYPTIITRRLVAPVSQRNV